MERFNKFEFARLLNIAKGQRSINQYGLQSEVDPGYISRLLRGLVDSPPLPPTIKKLADKAHNEITYEDLMVAAGYLERGNQSIPATPSVDEMARVPIYGEVRTGEPLLVLEQIIGYDYVPAKDVKGGEYFFVRVKGDSMIGARIQDGDLVLVRKQPTLEDGQIGLVIVDGKPMIKKFYRQGNLAILKPENAAYQPIVAPLPEVTIVGEVVEAKIKFRGRK
ncbi:MAG: hypothetical protein HPY81_06495 [Firmicutes bacterium]|nr:hypothetical protein [Bacillota bacterium]